MSVSDIIKTLSYTTPLTAGSSYTTEKFIGGQYSSLSISFNSDQDTDVLAQFSPDGINWDISIAKSFSAGVGSYENLVVLSKWMRLVITNNSLIDQTYLRVYTYGAIDNTSLNALIQKVGNVNPEIDVGNLPLTAFGDLSVSDTTHHESYVFNAGNTSIPSDNDIQSFNSDLQAGDILGSVVPRIDFADRCINLKMNGDLNNVNYIQGCTTKYNAGCGVTFRFTGKWSLSDSDLGATLLVGTGYINNGVRSDFYGFGWSAPGAPCTYDNWGINYVIPGGSGFIPRTSFNVDKADGTGLLPALDTSKINVFQIKQTYLGGGPIKFYIMNPDGDWVLVHVLKFPNSRTSSSARDPSFGFAVFGFIPPGSTITSGVDSVSSCSFGVFHDFKPPIHPTKNVVEFSGVEKSISASTETVIFSLQNYTTFQGSAVNSSVLIDTISVGGSGSGNNSIIIRAYVNSTLVGPVWGYVNNYSQVRKDEVGTASGGLLVESFVVGRNDALVVKSTTPIKICPNTTITFTAFSGGTADVFLSVTYRVG